jgi:hypothetical protein
MHADWNERKPISLSDRDYAEHTNMEGSLRETDKDPCYDPQAA